MSDYGDGYDDAYDDEGAEWFYVEDYYDQADDLAEHTCPSPPVGWDDNIPEDDDLFDYWQDLEYLSDGGYWDTRVFANEWRSLKNRKSRDREEHRSRKRRKTGSRRQDYVAGPVVWKSHEDQDCPLNDPSTEQSNKFKPFALLKDWRDKVSASSELLPQPGFDAPQRESKKDPVSSEGFDLGDLKSVAELLSGENLETLQSILSSQGLDPEAAQTVLQDMIEGREPEFENEDIEGEEEGGDVADSDDTLMADTSDEPKTVPIPDLPQTVDNAGGSGTKRKLETGEDSPQEDSDTKIKKHKPSKPKRGDFTTFASLDSDSTQLRSDSTISRASNNSIPDSRKTKRR